MEEKKKIGYWRIFSELFWASFKALVIVLFLSALKTGFVLNVPELSNGLLDSIFGSFLLHLWGGIMFLPILAIFVLLIASPLVIFILKKNWWDLYVLIISGAVISLIFFKWIPVLLDQDSFSYKSLISGNIDYLFGGCLTGYFLFKQVEKRNFKKEGK